MADELALAPAEGVTVVWDRAAAAALARGDGEADAGWRLDGSLDPDFAALRVVTGATADGSLLCLCAARPEDARHHDEDAVAAALISPDGEVAEIEEALVSTEYAADGSVRRLGLELYRAGTDYPVRGAGDAISARTDQADGRRRERADLRFRLDGSEGTAVHEVIRRA